MRVYTIGFGGKSAQAFFAKLSEAGVEKLIDIRRSNNTLYCGFTRSRDLPFFLERLGRIQYVHEPEFAPSVELLRDYQVRMKKNKKDPDTWPEYVRRFSEEIAGRAVMDLFRKHAEGVRSVCLLCTEPIPDKCHRRLLAEYIQEQAGDAIDIIHL